jgi:hypothetical protein
VVDAVGGVRGVLESVLPSAAFIAAYALTDRLRLALVLALAAAAVLLLARAVGRLPLGPAVSGAVLVGICAFTAARTGDAAAFYGPGLVINVAYALVCAVSTFRLPRLAGQPAGPWPLIGLVVGSARGQGLRWRTDPRLVRVHRGLTWMWVGVFVLRLAVELPLYLADATTALGIARLVLGLPVFALAAWVTWRVVRPLPEPAAPAGPARSQPR